ncbi:monovalent cation:proton antiporter family protein [Fulvivirga lutimaris]|uniref:monovalent cation:proton antiporter family protein n=1 Tax=Fulvivirga lutimaris TaxID=1819566 RepID=UPI0012BBC85A|nr:cation:proton antiporter [Fulvivirga lutimaris]MTI41359.1 potassium transporter TrkA [Fulvivirga lutimaris]
MNDIQQVFILFLGFVIVAIAANQIAKKFQAVKLPLITGLLIIGVVSGPFFLNLIPSASKLNLQFVNDISLAFIAFAAAAELYLKDLRGRLKSIKWMTFGQLVVTFIMSALAVYLLADSIHFMQKMDKSTRIAAAILTATIFVARSPASAIAIINEVRAKGPFTQTAMGVTVLKDFLVIILFAICMSLANVLVNGAQIDFWFLIIIIAELAASFIIGYLLGRVLILLLSFRIHTYAKIVYILSLGFSIYLLSYFIKDYTYLHFGKQFHIEPLLICILASFIVTNYSKYRHEFIKLLEDVGPIIYVCFFTLAGASMSLDLLLKVWPIALLFFFIRLVSMIIGSFIGGSLAGDPPLYNRIGWMPYITQAGVGLGLATIVANNFPSWGAEFSTLIIAVIVINQVVGPPFFKWALSMVGESHQKAETPVFDGVRDAIIFGFESQSVALARQLKAHGWEVKLATRRKDVNKDEYPDIDIREIDSIDLDSLNTLEAGLSEAVVLMLTDDENYELTTRIYEHIGTKDIIVRLNNHYNFDKFHKLGALVVDPSTAMVSLMDHFVRSPQATSLLLGMQEGQDTIDLQVLNPNLFGLPLREMRLPQDVIILSIRRKGQMIISHGYTRLRKGDWLTMVGSNKSLNKMTLLFDSSSN